MLEQFLAFVLSVWRMMVSLFQYTNLGGIRYDVVLVSIMILSLVIRTILVKMR